MHKFQASKWFIMCSLNAYYDNKRKTLKYILYSFYFLVFLVLVVESSLWLFGFPVESGKPFLKYL